MLESKVVRNALAATVVALTAVACKPEPPSAEALKSLAVSVPAQVDQNALCQLYKFGADSSADQRTEMAKRLKDVVVEWDVRVFELGKSGDSTFTLVSAECATPANAPGVSARLFIGSTADEALVRRLRTNDVVRIRGRVKELRFSRFLMLDPAVIADGATVSALRQRSGAQLSGE